MKRILMIIGTVLAMAAPCTAAVRGSYTPDDYTLHLYHFDGDANDAVSSNPIHLTPAYGATVTESSYEGFGTALNTYEGSSNTSANQPIAYVDEVSISNFTGSDGAFTFEAVIRPAGSIPNHMQIISGEDDSSSTRGWQFRINTSGQLEFIKLTGTQENFTAVLPTVGEHAWAPGQWFHVAVTYNGQENTGGNLSFYWTRLDSGASEANLLASFQMSADLLSYPRIDFAVGNEGRDYSGENFEGLVDEVRISSIARGPEDMLLAPGGVPPVILSQPSDVRVRTPNDAVFEAVFESQTEPTAVWYKTEPSGEMPVDTAGGRIFSEIIFDNQTQQYTARLVFTETLVSDAGFYYCRISNASNVQRSSSAARLLAEGLVAYWTLDVSDYADGMYVDTVSGRTASVWGVPVFVEGADGQSLGAVQINADSGWAVTEPLDLTGGTGAMTLSLWAQRPSGMSLGSDVQMETWPQGTLLSVEDGLSSGGRWQHICVVYTGTSARVYVDGVFRTEGPYVLPSDTTAQLTLGGWIGGVEIFEGRLDDVRIYNYGLSEEEAAEVYYEMTGVGVCLLGHTSEYDLTGPAGAPDCVVDLYDLAVFASVWLEMYTLPDLAGLASQWLVCTYYPTCN
ncbi:MAG TPA: immunoglobulin domain-containing protein [Anaerohalosphaeraceae bacterium]|nr:immunoglobulin domain-containing protein [Anaerohalosphaeraceae bacterium]